MAYVAGALAIFFFALAIIVVCAVVINAGADWDEEDPEGGSDEKH